MRLPNKGEKWKHYKGGVYEVTDIVYGAEDADLYIRILYSHDGRTFSRPLSDFLELVNDQQRFIYDSP